MVRLSLTREQKRKRGMMGMASQLSNITRFGDITVLTGGEAQVSWTLASWVVLHIFQSSSCCCKEKIQFLHVYFITLDM